MDKVTGKLTVFFDNPFWVGVFEVVQNGRLAACKVTFGSEPKDCEVYEFILKHYCSLNFSPAVKTVEKAAGINPKRRQREVRKVLETNGIGTKSQQALKKQQEQLKTQRKIISKEKRKMEEKLLFEKKQQKKKQRKRGR